MNKSFVFSIVSLLVLSLFLFGCTGRAVADQAPTSTEGVRANSCDADDMCETNGVLYSHQGFVINPYLRSTHILGELQVVNELNKPEERIKISDHSIESLRPNIPLRLSSAMGYVELDHSARVSNLFLDQNRIVSDKIGEPLVLSSDSKTVRVEDNIEAMGNIVMKRNGAILQGTTKDGWQMNLIRENNFSIDIGEGNTNGVSFYSNGKTMAKIWNLGALTKLNVYGSAYMDQNLSVVGSTDFNGKTTLRSTVELSSLKGTGNAYACINAMGQLYRSKQPCR